MEKDPKKEQLALLFIQLGLLAKQAVLYSALLDRGEERVSVLAQKTGIKRGNAYALLKEMKFRGIVEELEKSGVIYFRPKPPGVLVEMLGMKEKEVSSARQLAEKVVPSLSEEWKERTGRPVIRYFAGEEGVRKVFEDIYGPKDDVVWGCVDLENAENKLGYVVKEMIPKRIKNKVCAKTLLGDTPLAKRVQERDSKELRESILVNNTDFPFPAEIDVYLDRVAMLSFRHGDFTGVIIENKDFAESIRSLFKLAFGSKNQK